MRIWTFSEGRDLELELLGKAREMGDEVAAIVINGSEDIRDLIAYGADVIYAIEGEGLSDFYPETYTDVITPLIKEHNPDIILIGATKRGKELAPRIATRLNVGCAPDCFDLKIVDGDLQVKRRVYGGSSIATETYSRKPKIATVPPRTFERALKDEEREGRVERVKPKVKPLRKAIKSFKEKAKEGVRLEDAPIIVSGGRGIKAREHFSMIKELTDLLGGEVGCSRPIASDLKWLSEDHWVGLSGHKIKPKFYIACGISGQIQHLAGMRDSRIIVAINKDRDAPIFKVADYGVVGDIYEVLPKLTDILKKKR
jgi:electron transfer flavoprotein alpha subunit